MRQIVLLAAVMMIVVGTVVTKFSDNLFRPHEAMARASTPSARLAVVTPPPASRGELSLGRAEDGHFHVDGRVDGRSGIHFIVDTGASVVALRESDAARIGHRPARGDYTATVSTANGNVKAALVRLDSIELGDVRVRDVQAVVLPDEALSVNLLGMAYLSKLKRFEFARGRLVLAQ